MFGSSSTSPFVAQQGWLTKQGGSRKTWRKRWFVLQDGHLRWYEPGWFTLNPVDGVLKGDLGIVGGSAGLCSSQESGTSHSAIRIVSPGVRTLYVYASSSAEQEAWLLALRRACAPPAPAGSLAVAEGSGTAMGTLNPAGGHAWRGHLSGDGQAGAASVGVALEGFFESSNWGGDGAQQQQQQQQRGARMPLFVDIDGSATVGSELRVRGAHLESLCMAWFALSPPSPPPSALDLLGDICKAPGFALIPSAKAQTWVVDARYLGARIGCLVRPAVGSGGRWGLLTGCITQPDAAAATLRLSPQPHTHKKYCDRRVRVCTAVGRYREGEVLRAEPSLPLAQGPLAGQWAFAWYRSAPLLDLHHVGGSSSSSSSSSSGAGAAGAAPLDRTQLAHAAAALLGEGVSVSELEYRLVVPRGVAELPPSPLDHEPSPSLAEIEQAMTPRAALAGAAAEDAAAAAAAAAGGGVPQCPLFRGDIGCMYLCAAVRSSALPPLTLTPSALAASSPHPLILAVSQAVGPIEPAPPRAREIWIAGATGPAGAPRVGDLLTGCMYYYGGWEGASLVSWVAIGGDGETRELKAPTASAGVGGGEEEEEEGGGGSAAAAAALTDSSPRALRIGQELLGCILKFKVQPVRWDGDAGHQESSRPTKEVVGR